MPKRSDSLLIENIIENADYVFAFIKDDTLEDLLNDKMKLYAVIRAFEIIGEAARMVSDETKSKYSKVEWRQMADFRNILTHHYFGVEHNILWSVIQNDLPYNYQLLKAIDHYQ